MNAIREIKNKLKKHPQIEFEESENSIYIFPENESGFIIGLEGLEGLEESPPEYTVSFEGWHESFNDAEEALECLAFGLSDSCRLKITSRGASTQKREVESKVNGNWVLESTTGLIFFPFWRKKVVNYKQNTLIKN